MTLSWLLGLFELVAELVAELVPRFGGFFSRGNFMSWGQAGDTLLGLAELEAEL